MSHYFSVQPIALGTGAAECLSSALQRIAVAHGVTRYQFVTNLRLWWKAEFHRHLPRCEELRWDGYSPNVGLAIAALRNALEIDFTGSTLISLQDVCAANCIGAIANSRNWCAGCFSDDLASNAPTYDRLVWRIQGYSRCSIHKLFLRTNCPHCGEHQNKHSRHELHLCCCCRQSLATQISKTEYAPRPEFGEAQIEALIENIRFIAPGDTEPLRTFFGNIDGADDYVVKHLGDIFHTRRLPVRPQLSSLIAVATHFSVDVIQLMTDPRQAASQATLNIKKPPRNRSTRPSSHRRQKRTAWLKTQLELAIKAGPPFPSTKEFCRRNDYSLSAARNTFPDLTSTLSGKHLDWKQSRANQLKARAMAAIADLSMSTSQLTIKEAVANVCTNTGAPVHVVRALIDASAFSLR